MRIALVFGVGLEHFFVEAEDRPRVSVVRREDRLRLPDRPGDPSPSYFFESLDFAATERRMEAYLAEFPVRSKPSEPHRHDGAEFIFVLSGRLSVRVDAQQSLLEAGDAMYFDSGAPHAYGNAGDAACTAVVVVAP
jgi:mannose-6-phosphate isomerase-like protein (cupin superfamily)